MHYEAKSVATDGVYLCHSLEKPPQLSKLSKGQQHSAMYVEEPSCTDTGTLLVLRNTLDTVRVRG